MIFFLLYYILFVPVVPAFINSLAKILQLCIHLDTSHKELVWEGSQPVSPLPFILAHLKNDIAIKVEIWGTAVLTHGRHYARQCIFSTDSLYTKLDWRVMTNVWDKQRNLESFFSLILGQVFLELPSAVSRYSYLHPRLKTLLRSQQGKQSVQVIFLLFITLLSLPL